MLNSGLPKVPTPPRLNPLPVAGAHFMELLRQVAQLSTSEERKAALQFLFKWFLLIEGKEEGRLSSEELVSWRGRFYMMLPLELREDFPWEAPASLQPRAPERPSYPRYHTPFRQYGFIAAKIVDTLPASAPPEMIAVFMQGLLQILQHHGERVEAATLAKHLQDLSGDQLQIPAEVVSLVERTARSEGSRSPAQTESPRLSARHSKGRRFHRNRR
jgi:hypothetical protein